MAQRKYTNRRFLDTLNERLLVYDGAMGIRNFFVIMGDPTAIGAYPEPMDNYDLTAEVIEDCKVLDK